MMVTTRQGARTEPFPGRDRGQDLQTDAGQGEDPLADTASHAPVIQVSGLQGIPIGTVPLEGPGQ